jgi:hypothetical protein
MLEALKVLIACLILLLIAPPVGIALSAIIAKLVLVLPVALLLVVLIRYVYPVLKVRL